MDRTLSALYDHRDDAISAVDNLVSVGIPRDHISVLSGSEPFERTGGAGGGYGTQREETGLEASLSRMFGSDTDRRIIEDTVSHGGATVVARVDEGQIDRATEIMERGAVDLDERGREFGMQGDGPYRPGAPSIGLGAETGTATTAGAAVPAAPAVPEGTMGARTGISGEEEVIPVMEEELQIGKREVSGGRVRVHSHVVEEPVSEDVRLRDESVSVERTPVDRPVRATDEPFQERFVEAEERHEEPVVSKQARVTEEVHLRKEAGEHVERVEDTVRHTEVDVEDERTTTKKGRK